MLEGRQQDRVIGKLSRFSKCLESRMFTKEFDLDSQMFQTSDSLYEIPTKDKFRKCVDGDEWGGAGNYCWFTSSFEVPENLEGQDLFCYPHIGGYEGMLWVNGTPVGNFASKINLGSHGNHYCKLIKQDVKAGEIIEIAIEYYAHHAFPGTQPLVTEDQGTFQYIYHGIDVCTKDNLIADSHFNLETLLQQLDTQNPSGYLRGKIWNDLLDIYENLYLDIDLISKEEFETMLYDLQPKFEKALSRKNSDSMPTVGIIGHSHMDTAWLWTQQETIKKCARTYSNQISLMKQYDEYKFLQSSTYHTEMIRQHYPELFEEIKEQVKLGKYEPNGGVWVESDCNIPGGEYLARQFLWGQRYTKKHFNYMADTYWLPDTFGYSAALPQIMQESGIKYFLTTKIDWNDTNKFPYDSFIWAGLDNSEVLVHFNRTHVWPDAKSVNQYATLPENGLKEKEVNDSRFIAYGFGDGGGGPQFEMIEMARRLKDLEGIPKVKHETVSDFMHTLEKSIKNPTIYSGELYLELHRGTLTNKHTIKRNNRLSEIALHDLEFLTVADSLKHDTVASGEKIDPMTEKLLVNQFHDILPGTCIKEATDQSIAETTALIKNAEQEISAILSRNPADSKITVSNTTSFTRDEAFYVPYQEGKVLETDSKQQIVTNVDGDKFVSVSGVVQDPFSNLEFNLVDGIPAEDTSSFSMNGKRLETPFYSVEFDERMFISSLIDKTADNREIRGKDGLAFNSFIVAEDVPLAWDNWDVDADSELKYKDNSVLLKSELVSMGSVELRIRSTYKLTEKSELTQDMIFYTDSKLIKFETKMNWNDDHRFLKTCFDTSILSRTARQEVQFGYIDRPTTRNNSLEKAKFEVCNHKYSDLSEPNYGVTILNDCKYGISVKGGSLRLSLHKGGVRPDPSGDHGTHYCSYGLLPHTEAFSAESVIQPAYEFNYHRRIANGSTGMASLVSSSKANVIIETIKPLEDATKGFIVRVYEAEGTQVATQLSFNFNVKSIEMVNLLEEKIDEDYSETLIFKPFEIKNIKVLY